MRHNARPKSSGLLVTTSAVLLLALTTGVALAHQTQRTILTPLLTQELPDLPGKEVVMMTVE